MLKKLKKIGLIPDWKEAWKFQSTQLVLWITVIVTILTQNPEILTFFPPETVQKYSPLLGVLVIISRVIDFTGSTRDTKDNEHSKEDS